MIQFAAPREERSRRAAEDADLVRRTRANDPDAFNQLVARHRRQALVVAGRLLGDGHDALEVCQEAFVRAFRNLGRLRDDERFAAWLLRIVTNLALNHRRDRAVDRRVQSLGADLSLRADALPPGRRRAAPMQPDEALAYRELASAIRDAVQALPRRQRLALVLFGLEGLSQHDVALIMDCSVEAVKWHVFQARRKLRQRLAEFLMDDPGGSGAAGPA